LSPAETVTTKKRETSHKKPGAKCTFSFYQAQQYKKCEDPTLPRQASEMTSTDQSRFQVPMIPETAHVPGATAATKRKDFNKYVEKLILYLNITRQNASI
jgi:hypothetical protein